MTGYVLITPWNDLVTHQILGQCLFYVKFCKDLGINPQLGPLLIQTSPFYKQLWGRRDENWQSVSTLLLIWFKQPTSRDCVSKSTLNHIHHTVNISHGKRFSGLITSLLWEAKLLARSYTRWNHNRLHVKELLDPRVL